MCDHFPTSIRFTHILCGFSPYQSKFKKLARDGHKGNTPMVYGERHKLWKRGLMKGHRKVGVK